MIKLVNILSEIKQVTSISDPTKVLNLIADMRIKNRNNNYSFPMVQIISKINTVLKKYNMGDYGLDRLKVELNNLNRIQLSQLYADLKAIEKEIPND